MVSLKHGKGRRCIDVQRTDDFQIQALSSICRALKQSTLLIDNKHNLTETLLAQLIFNLRKHYETHYGKDSAKPRPVTIPAARLFADVRVNGGLHSILASLLEGATVRDLLPWDKLFDHEAKTLLPLLYDIDKALHTNGLFFAPTVFLNKVPVGQLSKLSKITIEHGGKIVTSEDKATHIIDWNDDIDTINTATSLEEEAVRYTSFQRNADNVNESLVNVHWLYVPDSADELLPISALPNLNDPAEIQALINNYSIRQRYYVSCKYILDCDVFNEWGNEADYENALLDEDDNNLDATAAGKRGGKKNKRNSSVGGGAAAASGRREAFIPQALNNAYNSFSTDKLFFPDVLPNSIADPSAKKHVLDLSSMQPSLAVVNAGSSVEVKEEHSSVLGKRSAAEVSAEAEAGHWFSLDRISDLERRYVPYLLDSPTAYMTMRNAMVTIYQQNPFQYLSCTDCRRKLSDDVSKVVRCHEFLDAFGVINHKVKQESRPQQQGHLLDEMTSTMYRLKVVERLQKYHLSSLSLQQSASKTSPSDKWTVEMDNALKTLVATKKRDWKAIGSEMSAKYNMTLMQCMLRFLETSLQAPPAVLSELLNKPATAATATTTAEASIVASSSSAPVADSQEVPVKGMHTSKQQELLRFKQSFQLITALEKLLVQMKSEHSSATKPGSADEAVEMTDETTAADEAHKDQIAAYENLVLHLRERVLQEVQTHMYSIGERVEHMLKDYVEERLAVVDNKMKVFSHVEDVLNLERERMDVEKHELLLQRIPQSTLPAFTGASSSYLTLPTSSSYAAYGNMR